MKIPKKAKNRATIWPSNPTPGHMSSENLVWRDTCTPVFTAALFTIAKTWKQRKRPSTDEQIKTVWCIYTMDHHSVIKRSDIMPSVATRMQPAVITLTVAGQQKTNDMWRYLCGESKPWHKPAYPWNRNRLTDTEDRSVVAKGRGRVWRGSLGLAAANYCYIKNE